MSRLPYVRLLLGGVTITAVSLSLALHAKGEWQAPEGSLMSQWAAKRPNVWIKSYDVKVMASSLRNGLVTENKDSNLSTVHTKAIFDRFLLKAFTSEAYQQRRVLGVRGDPTAIKGISYCPPGFAVEEQSKDEVIFREGNSPLRMYYGVIEHKPQFVGFPHQVAFNIAVALDVKEASIGDKLRFLFDSWVARRYLSDAVRTTSKKDKAQFVFDSEGST